MNENNFLTQKATSPILCTIVCANRLYKFSEEELHVAKLDSLEQHLRTDGMHLANLAPSTTRYAFASKPALPPRTFAILYISYHTSRFRRRDCALRS